MVVDATRGPGRAQHPYSLESVSGDGAESSNYPNLAGHFEETDPSDKPDDVGTRMDDSNPGVHRLVM